MSKYDKVLVILTVWLIVLATLVRFNLIAFFSLLLVGATISLAIILFKQGIFKKQIKSNRLKKKAI